MTAKDDEFWGYSGTAAPLAAWEKKRAGRYPGLYYDYQNTIDAELRYIHRCLFFPSRLTVIMSSRACVIPVIVSQEPCFNMY